MIIGVRNIAVLALIIGAAASADEPTDAERLKTSLENWEKAKQKCGGDYSYQVRWSSAFGFGHTTTIVVKGNKVTERKFEEFSGRNGVKPGENPPEPKAKWTETGKAVGTHQEGAAARTVDELYAEAAKLLAAKLPEGQKLALAFDKEGILNYCFTVDTRIADDAPRKGVAPFQLTLAPKKK